MEIKCNNIHSHKVFATVSVSNLYHPTVTSKIMLKKLVGQSTMSKYNKITKNTNESDETDDRHNPLSDAWDIQPDVSNRFIWCNDNSIRLKQRDKNNKEWISCFGTKIVTKGEYKRWQIKILPRNCESDINKKRYINKRGTAKVMIGVVDIESLREKQRGIAINSQFWMFPHFGYAFCGENGKKYHKSNGETFSSKYKIGDVITVELNRKSNRHIMHNDLRFYTNSKVDGLAFTVDHERNYVLAVALCSEKYDIQISN